MTTAGRHEIGESLRSEEDLRQSEERFRLVVQNSRDASGLLDTAGTITWISPVVEQILGWTPDQLVGRSAFEVVHPDDLETGLLRAADAYLTDSHIDPVTLRMAAADGTWQPVEVAAGAIRDEDGDVQTVIVNLRDARWRAEAEEALRHSEQRFRALVQNSFDAVLVLDANGRISYASPAIEQLWGRPVDGLMGTMGTEFVHEDDRHLITDGLAEVLAEPNASMHVEVRGVDASGVERWLEAEAVNLVHDEAVEGVVVHLRDITDRHAAQLAVAESEERFRALLENSADAVVVADSNAVVVYASPAIEHLFGRHAEELVGAQARHLVHPDDLQIVVEKTAAVYATPGASTTIEIRVRNAQDEYRWVQSAYNNLTENPHVRGVVIHIRDITDRRIAEEALRASKERFRSLVEHSDAIVDILDQDGVITWISDNTEGMLGYRPDELQGHSAVEHIHPDDVGRAREQFADVIAQPHSSQVMECRIEHAAGGWRWFECVLTNRMADPVVGGIIGNFRDITDRKLAEMALADSERLFRGLAQSSPVGIYQQDENNDCVYVNERWQEITGYQFDEVSGRNWRRILHPADADRLGGVAGFELRVAPLEAEFRVVRPTGEVRWVALRTSPILDESGVVIGSVGTIEDITERRETQRDNQRLIDVFDATNDLVGIADPRGELLYFNASARRFFGLPERGSISGFDLVQSFPPSAAERLATEIQPALEQEGMWSGELTVTSADGQFVPMLAQLLMHRDSEQKMEFFSGVLHDISERKRFESALAHQATHDPLTGLPNRSLLLDRLDVALTRAKRHNLRVAVLFLDLDHFKVVNDSLGHDLGDRLLVSIAERLQVALRPGDTIARFGGDEFVVLCQNLHSRSDAIAIADRVIASVSGPFVVDDAEVFVGVSIGIAFPDDPDADPGTLIRDADAAMYRAKERGRGRWEIFDNDLRASAVDRLDIENALRRALDRRELRVYYQPIIDLESGGIAGVEALLRWEHHERGLLLPGDFITIAEETGLIVPIGLWVLDQACRQVQRWQASIPDLDGLVVSVNLSGRQLGHPKLVEDVAEVLEETGLPADRLELEITESVLMDDVEMSEEMLGRLNELGVRLVVDDFGTGYSSMSYLRRFPVDLLKVDREFVDGLGTDPSDSAIVAAIVTLAHTLGLEAVAEGVETTTQLDELRSLGCDKAQGFHIARPSSGDDIAELLEERPMW
ncbi:MAG: PAS domain S-box protein [Actinobacteria bacterium]|nr:PAS domain S-box protein [Actinomycetota bacterium]